jgi:hypothetical protein
MLLRTNRATHPWLNFCGPRTLCAISAFFVWLLSMETARADCPIKVEQSTKDERTYREREAGKRCEGLLPLFVSGNTNIQLIGFEADDLSIDQGSPSIRLKVLAPETTDPLHIRAVARGIQNRYRMDSSPLGKNLTFDWRLDVLQANKAEIDRASLGLLACTNKCLNHSATVYFPVMIARPTNKTGRLSVLLRSEVTAGRIVATLRPEKDGTQIDIPAAGNLRLAPDRVTRLPLPETSQGRYRLTVNARTINTDEPMGRLQAQIYILSHVK